MPKRKKSVSVVQPAIQKSIFSLKNPGPLLQFSADLLNVDSSSVKTPYTKSIWVYRCIQIWQRVSTVPLLLRDSPGKEIKSGPLYFLLNNPNSDMTLSKFLKYLLISLGNDGEYFILKENGYYTGTGIPKFLTIVWPKMVKIEDSDKDQRTGKINSYTLQLKGGATRKVPAESVITDSFPNPYTNDRGLAPLEALRLTVDSDYKARQHNKYMMERHGRISGLVSFDQPVGNERLETIAQLFREKYEGSENAGATAFLDSGARYSQLALSMKDMDWLEGQKISREEICAAFGIPPNCAGILDKATYSNFKESSKSLWEDCLMPLGNMISDKLNKEIYGKYSNEKQYVHFDFVNAVSVLQEDISTRIDRYLKLISGGMMTPKQAASLCQIDLGNPDPAHDMIWGSISLVPVSDFTAQPEPEPQTPTQQSDDLKAMIEAVKKIEEKKEGLTPEEKDVVYQLRQAKGRTIVHQGATFERQLRQQLKSFFFDQRSNVLANFEKISNTLKAETSSTQKTEQRMPRNPKLITEALIKGKDWNAELLRRTKPALQNAGIASAKNLLTELGMNRADFRLETLQNFFIAQEVLMQKVNLTTKDALLAASTDLVQALDEGMSPEEAAANMRGKIKDIFNSAETSRRITIARTEIGRSINGARFEEMKDVGVEKHEWLTVNDGYVRDSHSEIDGEIVEVGAKFSNGLEYPGDPSGDAGETINCRCTSIAVLEK